MGVGGIARAQLIVLATSVFVAAFFAVLRWRPFSVCVVYALAIGNSVFWAAWALHRLQDLRAVCWKTSAIGIGLGSAFGFALARGWEVRGLGRPFLEPDVLAPPLAGALVFGTVIAYYFHMRAQVAEGRAQLREEMLRRLEHQQQLTEAELKLLQAQIEPHFLFNTLSNVLQLINANPGGAKRMLVNLTRYLRASLQRTRAGATTLGEELDLVRAYLEIQAERMGTRLAYRIECPADLGGLSLPPLLLQPLVENAVRHGLEAKPGGGEVRIRAAREGDALLLEVLDTGPGLAPESRPGVGLTNVRSRVRAISQGRGRVVMKPNTPQGLCVLLSLPLRGEHGGKVNLAAGGNPP
jgi:signal transduction histidine kinase